jgi:Ca2+-binding RTX toxin-like protein
MRKSVLLLASMALAVLLASGVALAATVEGTPGNDYLVGTS